MEKTEKAMTPTERERIEKEAEGYANLRVWPTPLKRYALSSYIAGATAEHDKARNQAIQDCIDKFQELSGHYIKQSYVEIFTAHFESLKTKP